MLPLLLSGLVLSANPGTELSGIVTNSGGQPIAKARVILRTAAPRVGVGYL